MSTTTNDETTFRGILHGVKLSFTPVCLKGEGIRRRIIASRADLISTEKVPDQFNRFVRARLIGEVGDGDFVVLVSRIGGRRSLEILHGTLPDGLEAALNDLKMIGDGMTDGEHANLTDGAQFTLVGDTQVVNVAA